MVTICKCCCGILPCSYGPWTMAEAFALILVALDAFFFLCDPPTLCGVPLSPRYGKVVVFTVEERNAAKTGFCILFRLRRSTVYYSGLSMRKAESSPS